MQKTPYVFPLVGGRKVEHLHANIEALNIALSPAQIAAIEGASTFAPGFPYNIIVSSICALVRGRRADVGQGDGTEYSVPFKCGGHFDKWPLQQAIRP